MAKNMRSFEGGIFQRSSVDDESLADDEFGIGREVVEVLHCGKYERILRQSREIFSQEIIILGLLITEGGLDTPGDARMVSTLV